MTIQLKKVLNKHKYEIAGVFILFIILLVIALPKFFSAQKSVQIMRIQQTLDSIIQRMIDRPETFIDITIAEGDAFVVGRGDLINGVANFSTIYRIFTMTDKEIKKILPDYKVATEEMSLTYLFMSGNISTTEVYPIVKTNFHLF